MNVIGIAADQDLATTARYSKRAVGEAVFCRSNRRIGARPFFSICIPQYNRTDFLVKACGTFVSQTFGDFEICISDDCSDDGKELVLWEYLDRSNVLYTYVKTPTNLRYDGNLRNAISLSAGEYVLLMGNDDGLTDHRVLEAVHNDLVRFRPVVVALVNYREALSGRIYRRVATTGVLGAGPGLAVRTFRNYSFVSGIVLKGDAARQAATDAYDGSEMYQMYLGTRLVAAGGRLLGIDRVCIDKDIQISGQTVDSYRLKPRLRPCPIVERRLPLGRLLEVMAGGLDSYHSGVEREKDLVDAARQLFQFTYPFWLVEYRRIQSWRYALGVFLALRPRRIAGRLALSRWGMLFLWIMYLSCGLGALAIPIRFFDALRPRLYARAKRLRSG